MLGRRPTYHLETLRLLRAVEAENASLKEELARSNGEMRLLRRSSQHLWQQLLLRLPPLPPPSAAPALVPQAAQPAPSPGELSADPTVILQSQHGSSM